MIFNTTGGGSNGLVWKPCNKKNGFNFYADSDTSIINLGYAQIGNLVLIKGNFTFINNYSYSFLYLTNPSLLPKDDSAKIFNNDGTQYLGISRNSKEISASSKNKNIVIGGFYETY